VNNFVNAGLPLAQGKVWVGNSSNIVTPTFAPVLGVPGTSTGTIGVAGATSHQRTATITPQAAAGTPTLTLPNTSGTFAVGASSPLALGTTTGNLTITGAAGQVLAGSGPAFWVSPDRQWERSASRMRQAALRRSSRQPVHLVVGSQRL
jgi:hypothetical protein